MKVGVLGSGVVARALGVGFLGRGDEVMLGTRDKPKLEGWQSEHPAARVGGFADAAAYGDVIVLAVKGSSALDAMRLAGLENLAGKPVIDTTNPISDAPPSNGVLSYFTGLDRSLMEQLQAAAPSAHLVKAFNAVGNQHMVNPAFDGGKPTMFICGNSDTAKQTVSGILDDFGWEVADMGSAESARAIEPLCMLWCIPGILHNRWDHAFKLLSRN